MQRDRAAIGMSDDMNRFGDFFDQLDDMRGFVLEAKGFRCVGMPTDSRSKKVGRD